MHCWWQAMAMRRCHAAQPLASLKLYCGVTCCICITRSPSTAIGFHAAVLVLINWLIMLAETCSRCMELDTPEYDTNLE
jgi:hypothetical protein